MTAFMLMCYLNQNLNGSVHFRNIKDCLFYAEKLSEQRITIPEKVESYKCMCKLVPYVDEKKTKVY
tara:strand:- start:45 stop:242 length:198 start_codon:yes stop_codon:yes gene_type:complete